MYYTALNLQSESRFGIFGKIKKAQDAYRDATTYGMDGLPFPPPGSSSPPHDARLLDVYLPMRDLK
jgi:hypothetical protein